MWAPRTKCLCFPRVYADDRASLAQLITNALTASPRRMYWLLLALKRCSKDQNNKIKWQQSPQEWNAAAQWRLSWLNPREVFPMESPEWMVPFDEEALASETEEVSVQHMPDLKDGYLSPREGWRCRKHSEAPSGGYWHSRSESQILLALQVIKYLLRRKFTKNSPWHPLRSRTPLGKSDFFLQGD